MNCTGNKYFRSILLNSLTILLVMGALPMPCHAASPETSAKVGGAGTASQPIKAVAPVVKPVSQTPKAKPTPELTDTDVKPNPARRPSGQATVTEVVTNTEIVNISEKTQNNSEVLNNTELANTSGRDSISEKETLSGKDTVTKKVTVIEKVSEVEPEPSPIEMAIIDPGIAGSKRLPQGFSAGRLKQFGYNFFRKGDDQFSAIDDVPVGSDYLIGTGDRINVTVWGSVDSSFELEVDRSGEVIIPKIGPVKVSGVRFGQLNQLLTGQMSKIFKNFQLSVTMGKLRMIKVYVVGEVHAPGDYTISSLSTILNALSAASGPTRNGSLRRIAIMRDGKQFDTVDLYDFFLKGDKSRDIRLQAGDTVFVPNIGPVVGIAGNVNRSAIYELNGEGNLKDLLVLANGLVPSAYLQRIQISRLEPHKNRAIIDVDIDSKSTGKELDLLAAGIKLKDMDLVKIFQIENRLRGYVRLEGHVSRPGDYAIHRGMRVEQLLVKDGLLPDHFSEFGHITRLAATDLQPELIFFNVALAMSKNPEHNIELKEFDSIRILSRAEFEEAQRVRISGEVQKPGEYQLYKNMRVSELLKFSGNPKKSAYLKTAEIKRYNYSSTEIVQYSFYINLEEAIKNNPEHDLPLLPRDEIIVKRLFTGEDNQVSIGGEVKNPGTFRYVDGMRLRDLLLDAGGIKKSTYTKTLEVSRRTVEKNSVTTSILTVDLGKALANDPDSNIKLQPHDAVTVHKIPNWVEETERFVTIKGEVLFPGKYPVNRGERISDVIRRSGGLTNKAYLPAAKFTRKSVQELQQKRMDEVLARAEEDLAQKMASIPAKSISAEEEASTKAVIGALQKSVEKLRTVKAEGRLVINLVENRIDGSSHNLLLEGGDVLEIPPTSSVVNVMGRVFNQNSFVYQPGRDIGWYLDKTGGPDGNAEISEMYLIKADGSVVSRQQSFFGGFFNMASADPGDTLVVPQKIEKVTWIREIKDWTQILANIALTAGTILLALAVQ